MEIYSFKTCPFCKEQIQTEAVKCRYCGEWIENIASEVTERQPDNHTVPETDELPPQQSAYTLPYPEEMEEPTVKSKSNPFTGVKWMNLIMLLFFGYGLLSHFADNKKPTTDVMFIFLVCSPIVAAYLIGFLAAKKPLDAKMRRLSIVLNMMFLVLCLILLLSTSINIGNSDTNAVKPDALTVTGSIFLFSFLGLTAVINLRAFWKKSPTHTQEPHQNSRSKETGHYNVIQHETEATTGEALTANNIDNEPPPFTPANEPPPFIPAKQSNYFIRHWRGDLSLPVSYWINGLLVTFLILVFSHTLAAVSDSASLKFIAATTLLVFGTAILATIWQCVGIWRSALKHVSRGGKKIWSHIAMACVILGAWNSIGSIWNTYIPQSGEMLSILTGDNKLPAYEITVLPGGTEILFKGGMRAGCSKELERVLSAVPQATVLHIESIGGRINEARSMIHLVQQKRLTTYTAHQCMSAATFVLMSGKERVVAKGAKVGFHSGSLPGITAMQKRNINDLVISTMRSAGVSDNFISKVIGTPFESMWYPTIEEMIQEGVVTSQTYGERFATSWESTTKLESSIQSLSKYPGFSAIQEIEPETYKKMMANFIAAIQSGKTEGEAIAVISENASALMDKYVPKASDDAVLSLQEQWINMLIQNKDTNSQACVAAFTRARINYTRAFPDWNMTNTLHVIEKVIRTGSARTGDPINNKAAEDDLTDILSRMLSQYGDDVSILDDESKWLDNSKKVCNLLLTMYQHFSLLPKKRNANLIRYMLNDAK